MAPERKFEGFVSAHRALNTAVEAMTSSNFQRVQFKRAVGEASLKIQSAYRRYRSCLEHLRQFEIDARTYRKQRIADAILPAQRTSLAGASQPERASAASSFDSSWDPYGWNTHEAQSPQRDNSPTRIEASSSLTDSLQTLQPHQRSGQRQSQAAAPIAPTRVGHTRSTEQALPSTSDAIIPSQSKGRGPGKF